MATDIMVKLGLKKDTQIGETSRVKKDSNTRYIEKAPDKLVRSPKNDTFTSSQKTNNENKK